MAARKELVSEEEFLQTSWPEIWAKAKAESYTRKRRPTLKSGIAFSPKTGCARAKIGDALTATDTPTAQAGRWGWAREPASPGCPEGACPPWPAST